jgi:hypothetical protein
LLRDPDRLEPLRDGRRLACDRRERRPADDLVVCKGSGFQKEVP